MAEIVELFQNRREIKPADRVLVARPGNRFPPLAGRVRAVGSGSIVFERDGAASFPERLPVERVIRKLANFER